MKKKMHTVHSPFPLILHCFMSSRLCFISALQKSCNDCQHLRKGRHYLALYPCHVCTLAWPPIVVRGKKVALWCAKWFTDLEDINKLFHSGLWAGSPLKLQTEALKKQWPEVDFSPVILFSLTTWAQWYNKCVFFFPFLCNVCHRLL